MPYQDDLETPGISPRRASPRKHKRHTPNLRRYARGRPHSLQRLCLRVENLGAAALLPRACSNFFSIFASLTRFAVVMQSLKNYRNLNLEILCSAERHAEAAQQRAGLIVVLGRGHDRDIHPFELVHLRVIDLRENQLIAQTERVIAASVE